MQQLDPNMEYVQHPTNPRNRFNWLFIIIALGALWLLYLAAAAIFQLPVAGIVDAVMGGMLLIFFITAGLLFWALAPKENR